MQKKFLAVMLTTLASPSLSMAAAHDELASAPRNAKCADNNRQGSEIVEVEALFKCFGDTNGIDAALSGLAGALATHHERAYGIVRFREGNYFARVEAPFNVSAPVFYKSDDMHYACVTVQNAANAAADDDQDVTSDGFAGYTATSTAIAAPAMPESRLLAATLAAPAEDADSQATKKSGDTAKADADDALPLQSGNPGGLRQPKAPPVGNTPAAMPEYQGKATGDAADKK